MVTHLDEGYPLVLVALARRVAVGPVRRHERDQRDDAAAAEEAGHFAHAPHGLGAVAGREPEVAVEAGPHVVAVQVLGRNACVPEERRRRRKSTTTKVHDDSHNGKGR